MNNRTILSAFSVVGAVMLLTGAIVYITGWTLSPYVYITGAVLFALSRWFSPHKGGTALRRLQRQQDISGLLLMAAGACMLLTRGNEWIVCLTLAAVIEVYTSIRIPQEERKSRQDS